MRVVMLGDARSPHVVRRAKALQSLAHEVHVVTIHPGHIEGVAVHSVRTLRFARKLNYLLCMPSVRRLTRRLQPDVLDAQYLTGYGFLGAMCDMHPLVVTAWGSDVAVSPQRSRLYSWLVKLVIRRADRIITQADHLRKRVIQQFGAPAGKVVTVTFGLDKLPPLAALAGVSKTPTVVCTRAFSPVYDPGVVVEAAMRVVEIRPDITVYLANDGPLRSGLEQAVHERGLSERIRFLGRLPALKLRELLEQSHVYVSSSVSDGASESLLEAMGAGLYPVVSDIPGNREWVQHGVNGLLFPVGNVDSLVGGIITALSQPDELHSAARRNRELVTQRALVATSSRAIERIYHEVVDAYRG